MAIITGITGLGICWILYLRSGARYPSFPPIPETALNKDIELPRYRPTPIRSVFAERTLPSHPFRFQKDGMFCSDCLIVDNLQVPKGVMSMHGHACTATEKEWKIIACTDAFETDYYISLDRYHFRPR